MAAPLLVALYDQLPVVHSEDDEELWTAGVETAMRAFRDGVRDKYTEGTLQRLLATGETRTRQAAALAIGLIGTPESVPACAAALHDPDSLVRKFASNALWELWFRGGTPEQNRRLREAAGATNPVRARAELDQLIREAPEFPEAYNQRAIWFFKQGQFARAAEDCEAVLRLNPYHYGAAAGLGQCYLKLSRPKAALRAFRQALEINPDLDLHDTIRALEALGGE